MGREKVEVPQRMRLDQVFGNYARSHYRVHWLTVSVVFFNTRSGIVGTGLISHGPKNKERIGTYPVFLFRSSTTIGGF